MSKLMFSALCIMAVAAVLWTVAVFVQIFHGNPDGWVDAAVLVQAVGLLPILVESKIEERRAK